MNRPETHPFEFIACLLFLTGTSVVASGRSQQPIPDSSTVTRKVTSRLTQVNVIAIDARGNPVHGLTQADFTVKEDGKPQPLKNFEEFGTQKPALRDVAPKLPPNV